MARKDILGGGGLPSLREMWRRLRALENATPLSSASVGRGRLRMYDGSELLIEDGNLSVAGTATVTGTLQITGQLNGDGTITWTGPVNLNGTTNVRGDMSVTGGGKVNVGSSMTLDPAVASGALVFSNGAQVFTNGSTVQLYLGNGVVQVSNTEARIQLGGHAIVVSSSGVRMPTLPTRSRANASNAVVGTVWADTSGNLSRVVL